MISITFVITIRTTSLLLIPLANTTIEQYFRIWQLFPNQKLHWIFVKHFHMDRPEIYLKRQSNRTKITIVQVSGTVSFIR